MSNSAIEHFTHPGHELVKFDSNKEYICDGCKAPGSGKTVGCSSCNDFNMHEFCGECPKELSTFMHPLHRLSLVVRKGHGMRTNERICDVCGDDLEGLFYRCKDCDFDLHPLCTQLPQELTHALHTDHPLVLQKPKSDGRCGVCNSVCKSWRYRCGKCDDFDIHLECVTVVISCATTREIRVPRPFTPQTSPLSPLHGSYAYGGLPLGNFGQPQPPFDGGYSYGGVPTGHSAPLPPRPLHGGYTYGGVPTGNYGPYYNTNNSGFVNNQAYNNHNPAYYHDQVNAYNESNHAYAQAYNHMYNPANNMYSSYGGVPLGQNLCNNIYCSPYGCSNSRPHAYNESNHAYAQAYNHMYNPANNMYSSYGVVPLGQNLCNNIHCSPYGCSNSRPQAYNMSIAYGNYQYPAISTQNSENQDHHTGAQNGANHDHHLGAGSTNGKVFKKMFKIVGALTLGVVSNVIFGISFPGL